MADAPQLILEDLLFPLTELRTNDKHSAQGERSGTQLQYGQQIEKMQQGDNRYGLMVSVRTDNEKSVNQPYFFVLEAYAIFTVKDPGEDADAVTRLVVDNGTPIVIGALRERLAELSARAPWGRFLINTILLAEQRTIAYI